jgi:hypothetical protein
LASEIVKYQKYAPTNMTNLKLINSDTWGMVLFYFKAEEVAICAMHKNGCQNSQTRLLEGNGEE